MPKTKRGAQRKKFDYNRDRKKLKRKLKKKNNPRIESAQIRNAWSNNKSTAGNLRDMGLAFDPNRSIPFKIDGASDKKRVRVVRKPYVITQLEEEANRPIKNTKTLSADLIEYVQYMIRHHKDNYKAMARDEKNYYQDTPKQIKRKINDYIHCHPDQYEAFVSSLAPAEPMVQ
ncbi:nucleolar protein 16 [Synchiropus picturatus]